ncbi:hypothetical protein [Lacihabitans sp. CS3-21]|uniref:hypothetical protein n=1 Tax=Lacihabitans sp. CS3-21 TaxID=2487332 RepID=UPI0020CB9658|nr:hypothetical protein [Lacihabitans sp. CS3-21]
MLVRAVVENTFSNAKYNVSSSISKFDLLKSNEETALGLGGVPFENTSGNAEYN